MPNKRQYWIGSAITL